MRDVSLFDYPTELDLPAARAARDEGIARGAESAGEDFAASAELAIRITARWNREFIVDDVWRNMNRSRYGDNRAMGAAIRKAVRAGVIAPTERYRPSSQPNCHANPRRVWRSLI
jgi:hypothetical protein